MCISGLVGQEEPFNGYCWHCNYSLAVCPEDSFGPHKTPEHLEFHMLTKHPNYACGPNEVRRQELAVKLGL